MSEVMSILWQMTNSQLVLVLGFSCHKKVLQCTNGKLSPARHIACVVQLYGFPFHHCSHFYRPMMMSN